MNLNQVLEKFQSNPKNIKMSAGKLSSRWKCTKEIISEAKIIFRSGNGDIPTVSQEVLTKVDNNRGTLESTVEAMFEPKNDLELAELHHIDLKKYRISTYWSKLKSNGKFTSSVSCALIKDDFSLEDFAEFVKGYKPSFKITPTNRTKDYSKETVDVEISLADFHLDKLDVEVESVESKMRLYIEVLTGLLNRCSGSCNINKVVFVIGNDLFQTDTWQGTTTSWTPVSHSVTWNVAYEMGFDLMVQSISLIREYADKVDVILVQGNHARTKEYYLAHALDVFFKSDKSVTFDREYTTTKFTVIGETFVGYHHGNTKIDDLPLLFATSPNSSYAFGKAKYREVHTGDKHYYLAKDIKGVRVQQMPSLGKHDQWHLDGNFINSARCGLALMYHATNGKIGEWEWKV